MKYQMLSTIVLQRTLDNLNNRIIINEGSSRSSKTYSLCQLLFFLMCKKNNILITVVRKTLPSLKATAYRDFMEIVKRAGMYDPARHNKSDNTFHIRNNEIEFISVDDFKKVKGRKRDYLFMNEANELSFNDFVQLALRTTKQIFMDYNPSHDEFHWIEEKIKTRKDVAIIRSTYKDNPYNGEETIKEIERLREVDPNLWRIYGLGLMGIASVRIYNHFEYVDELPEVYDEVLYGLDFGFNHPTAMLEIRVKDNNFYWKEIIYGSGLTNSDLIRKMDELKIDKNKYIFYDSAEPQRGEEIRRAGYNAHPANKDVKKGIDTVKSHKIFITKDSLNLQKEYRGYSWKTTVDGKILDEPVMLNDDLLCAGRYGCHSYLDMLNKQPNIRVL